MPACQGDDGWFPTSHPRRPAAKKAKREGEIVRLPSTYFYICDFSCSLFAQFHIYDIYIQIYIQPNKTALAYELKAIN